MKKEQNYQGWSNHETQVAYLWLMNDDSSYQLLQEAYNHGDEDYENAEWLESVMNQQLEQEASAGMWGDLLRSAFNRVNWIELIESCWP